MNARSGRENFQLNRAKSLEGVQTHILVGYRTDLKGASSFAYEQISIIVEIIVQTRRRSSAKAKFLGKSQEHLDGEMRLSDSFGIIHFLPWLLPSV